MKKLKKIFFLFIIAGLVFCTTRNKTLLEKVEAKENFGTTIVHGTIEPNKNFVIWADEKDSLMVLSCDSIISLDNFKRIEHTLVGSKYEEGLIDVYFEYTNVKALLSDLHANNFKINFINYKQK